MSDSTSGRRADAVCAMAVASGRQPLATRSDITYDTAMEPRLVLDTNVLVAAIRSRNGASFRLLKHVRDGKVGLVLSVPLVLEYEDALKRSARKAGLTWADVDDLLDYLCSVGEHREVFFLWRPCLKDPGDDMVLEVGVESGCDFLVTHNVKDFVGAERCGVRVVTPGELLRALGELP